MDSSPERSCPCERPLSVYLHALERSAAAWEDRSAYFPAAIRTSEEIFLGLLPQSQLWLVPFGVNANLHNWLWTYMLLSSFWLTSSNAGSWRKWTISDVYLNPGKWPTGEDLCYCLLRDVIYVIANPPTIDPECVFCSWTWPYSPIRKSTCWHFPLFSSPRTRFLLGKVAMFKPPSLNTTLSRCRNIDFSFDRFETSLEETLQKKPMIYFGDFL